MEFNDIGVYSVHESVIWWLYIKFMTARDTLSVQVICMVSFRKMELPLTIIFSIKSILFYFVNKPLSLETGALDLFPLLSTGTSGYECKEWSPYRWPQVLCSWWPPSWLPTPSTVPGSPPRPTPVPPSFSPPVQVMVAGSYLMTSERLTIGSDTTLQRY